MNKESLAELVAIQKAYYLNGKTREIKVRINNLLKLKTVLIKNQEHIFAALKKELFGSFIPNFFVYKGSLYFIILKLSPCI